MQNKSISNELLDFFNCSENTPSASAFVQARNKLAPNVMQELFHRFAAVSDPHYAYKGFRLLAVDGSEIPLSARLHGKSLHLNAMFDLNSRTYVDAIVEDTKVCDEQTALTQMVDRSDIEKAIILADRGYEGYNTLAHVQEKNWNFLFRIKDGKGGIASGLDLPQEEEFDVEFDIRLTFKQTKKLLKNKKHFKRLKPEHKFDFLPLSTSSEMYNLKFRVVRFKTEGDKIETLITNLKKEEFSLPELKELYERRWGIETSFRYLKHTVGLINFHAQKEENIKQEVFARLTMYNFSALVTLQVSTKDKKRKYEYKVNFSNAVNICKKILMDKISSSEGEKLISRFLTPIRKGRSYERSPSRTIRINFAYRIA